MEYTISQIGDSLNQAYTNKFEKVKVGRINSNMLITCSNLRHMHKIVKQTDSNKKLGYSNGSYVYQPLCIVNATENRSDLVPWFVLDNTHVITGYPFDSYWANHSVLVNQIPTRYSYIIGIPKETFIQIPRDISEGILGQKLLLPHLHEILLKLVNNNLELYTFPTKYVRQISRIEFR